MSKFSRIKKIQGVGLFRNADASRFELRQLSLIYGENAAGKSTFAAILRSLALNAPSIVSERRTFTFEEDQYVELQDADGRTYEFTDARWTKSNPDMFVFDSSFVEDNVYSGSSIDADQQRSLLDFAIGETAVREKREEQEAAQRASEAREKVRGLEAELNNHRGDLALHKFVELPEYDDPDGEIEKLQKDLDQAKRINALKRRKKPTTIDRPQIELGEIQSVLESSLESAHEAASETVKEHVTRLHSHGAESWLSTGLGLIQEGLCPFCGQSLQANELIAAYRTYFDKAYNQQIADVAGLSESVERLSAVADADTIVQRLETQKSVEAPWTEDIDLDVTTVDEVELRQACAQFRSELYGLVEEKKSDPMRSLDGSRLSTARLAVTTITSTVDSINVSLRESAERIANYVTGLESADTDAIEREIQLRKLSKIRHRGDVSQLCLDRKSAKDRVDCAEREKKEKRDEARKVLNSLLDGYRAEINRLLEEFNASFSIEVIKHDYQGQEPRIKYAIAIRNKSLDLSQADSLLRSVLSDGDKRALAFAFFTARLRRDPSLNRRVVVLDDPMTSLDANRRQATTDLIVELAESAKQVVVLAHDKYYLRAVMYAARRRQGEDGAVSSVRTALGEDGFVVFSDADLDLLCEGDYVRSYRRIRTYLDGGGLDGEARRDIRILMEGYLRRRFPTELSYHATLGDMIQKVADAPEGSPLAAARGQVDALAKINRRTSPSHHAQGEGYEGDIAGAELRGLCEGALDIVHGWGS